MATYRELVNIVLDELKLISDDSIFTEEHVMFLLDNYRTFVLKQRYSDIRKEIPDSNYQTVCIDLIEAPAFDNDPCGGKYLKSKDEIPKLVPIGVKKISTIDYFQGNINYVSRERFKYAGNGKYAYNQIYGTIGPDSHLYLKSSNPQVYHLCKVKVTGIFEDSRKAAELSCEGEEDTGCDVMDKTFPLEEALIPVMQELILKELGGQKYQSEDKENNAADDLANIATFMRTQLANGRRSDLYKQY